MPDSKIDSCLNEQLVHLSQSANIDCLVILNEEGKQLAAAGECGDLSREDKDNLLTVLKEHPYHHFGPGEEEAVHFIKQGAIECFITPINATVYLVAMASIERPSVLIRTMLNEILLACHEIAMIAGKDWPAATKKGSTRTVTPKIKAMNKESTDQTENIEETSLESLIDGSTGGIKKKDASKFWDGASMDEDEYPQNGKTISFEEARRAGLVPDDKK
ncbi:MAG: hypothetical protein JXR32_06080 [Anaerolineaceae bacterium]|nr:hypothetical protein [Anaerolineaceae bacterium]